MSDVPACPHDEIVSVETLEGPKASCQLCGRSAGGDTIVAAVAAVAGIRGWEVPVQYSFENSLWTKRQ